MGPSTKDASVVPPDRRDPVTRKASLVVGDGVVRGTWKLAGDDVAVTWLDPVVRPGQPALEAAAERVGEIVGRTLGVRLA
jgi:hypothetical protein